MSCGCQIQRRGDEIDFMEIAFCPLHQAAGELLDVVAKLTKNNPPHESNGDWACVECTPNSDMLIEGFRCAYHRGLTLVALIEGTRRPEEG